MYRVLQVLVVLDIVLLAVGVALGAEVHSTETMGRHFLVGLFITIFTCFIHCLVLFYLIGTGTDIREAVQGHDGLREEYVPWTRRQKRRAFPPACFAIAFMILAALLGGEVHSRLLGGISEDGVLPFRDIPFWWIHVAALAVAILLSLYAFWVELSVVRENRRAIDAINLELARREADLGPS